MVKKILLFFMSVLILVSLGFVFETRVVENKKENIPVPVQEENKVAIEDNKTNELQSIQSIDELEKAIDETEIKSVRQSVPFALQAPFANWKDSIFQNACEEASIVMAMNWIKNADKISSQQAFDQIKDIVKFENKTFGYNEDTDLSDIEKIFKQHFAYQKVEAKKDIKLQDIINELQKGNIILVPAYGRALKNPNFTQPGPVAHMLVIVGYDKDTKEFITNDPGTKKGEGFRYKEDVLFEAIWQYPKGKGPIEPPLKEEIRKGMLVVSK